MKRKTDATNGTTYVYTFADGTVSRLTAGSDEVTEDMIRRLKKMDNREYEKDLDAAGRRPDEKEKKDFKKTHPDDFQQRKWNLSLDYISPQSGMTAEQYLYRQMVFDNEEDSRSRLIELADCMPARRKQIVLMYLDGWTQSEIAGALDISPSTVRDHMDAAKKFIKKNF